MSKYSRPSPVVQPLLGLYRSDVPVGVPAPSAVAARPLTNAHISPLGVSTRVRSALGKLQFWVDGTLIKVTKPSDGVQIGGGRRSVVFGFSRGSRRRLQIFMATLLRLAFPLFVTLTYPAEFPLGYTQWKKHLDIWAKRLHRKYPKAGFIWRLEPQRRGAPHYHLLLFGVPYGVDVQLWIAQSWFEVVKSGDAKHLEWGANVQPIKSARGVRAYVGKYMGKVQLAAVSDEVDWSKVGRWWGVRYAENLPFSDVVGGELVTFREAARFMRYLRRYLKGQGVTVNSQMPGMTVFVGDPARWFDVLDRLLRDGAAS